MNVYAAQASLSLTQLSADSIQVSILGGDANSRVSLHYVYNSNLESINIGTTNSNGNLVTTISSGTHHILGGARVYVIVGNQQSNTSIWPDYANSGYLSLNPSGLSMLVGQVVNVSASAGSNLFLVDNPDSTVASTSIVDSNIKVMANKIGTTNMIICAPNIGCNTLYVSVGSVTTFAGINPTPILSPMTTIQPQTYQPSISLNQSSTTLNVGDNQILPISGSGIFGISSNSNLRVAFANISGSNLNVKAISSGIANVGVCSVNDISVMACVNLIVNVNKINNLSSSSPNVSLSDSDIKLNIGQSKLISIYGNGGYYISQNSGASSVSANISGSILNVTGITSGGSNISVCIQTDKCTSVYVYISSDKRDNVNISNVKQNTSNTSNIFNRNLYLGITSVGVSDPDVVLLQKRLNKLGFFSGPITGYFGIKTKLAVQEYQKKHKISSIGVVGPSTRLLLNSSE